MDRDVDLLPWILAGCLAIGGAVITAVALSAPQGTVDAASSAAAAAPAAATAPAPLSPAAPPRSAVSTTAPPPPAVSATPREQLPPGQVWECDVGGQRVFSDTKCGAHASVRQLRDLNLMDASAAPQPAPYPYPGAGAYGGAGYPPSYYAPQDDEAAADYSGDAYVGERVVVAHDRVHREHRPRSTRPHPRPHN
jgi:hypothetical protein